jgi:hypothetical protein
MLGYDPPPLKNAAVQIRTAAPTALQAFKTGNPLSASPASN